MKSQVRFFVVALTTFVIVVIRGLFYSMKQPIECAVSRETEIQYRFVHQTLSSTADMIYVPPKKQSTSRPMNLFLSPYHKYYPVNCTAMFTGNQPIIEYLHHKLVHQREMNNGSFPVPSDIEVAEWLWNCDEFQLYRHYPSKPMSLEEANFPLAYIIVAHKDAAQVERLLRAIYQPQNVYCIHPDLKSSAHYMHAIRKLVSCFPNVIIASKLERVQWGDISRLMADIHCMKDLLRHSVQWRYLLNLCGQDFPLKTNLELVRQMKAYSGKNYIEGEAVGPRNDDNFAWRTRFHFFPNSTDGYKAPLNSGVPKNPPPFNINIYKGDNYMAATRGFVDFMINDPIAQEFLQWCSDTYMPEETFPNTLNRVRNAPGGDPSEMAYSNIRFRKWADRLDNPTCRGKFVRQLCIFESNYLEHLYTQPHLFVNKFHYDYDPVTMQCMEELLDDRSRRISTY